MRKRAAKVNLLSEHVQHKRASAGDDKPHCRISERLGLVHKHETQTPPVYSTLTKWGPCNKSSNASNAHRPLDQKDRAAKAPKRQTLEGQQTLLTHAQDGGEPTPTRRGDETQSPQATRTRTVTQLTAQGAPPFKAEPTRARTHDAGRRAWPRHKATRPHSYILTPDRTHPNHPQISIDMEAIQELEPQEFEIMSKIMVVFESTDKKSKTKKYSFSAIVAHLTQQARG